MDVAAGVDRLISSLQTFKAAMPSLERDEAATEFDALFADASSKLDKLVSGSSVGPASAEASMASEKTLEVDVLIDRSAPRWWVNRDWTSDPLTASKPNMREYIEAVTGRSVEDVSSDPNVDWSSVVSNASALLYGVTAEGGDSRNWDEVMSSTDIIAAARLATKKMHGASVAVHTELNADGTVSQQVPVLVNRDNKILQLLSGDKEHVGDTLKNFGIDAGNLASQVESRVTWERFDQRILDVLRALDAESAPL